MRKEVSMPSRYCVGKVGEEIEGCGGIQGCGWSREK